MFSSVKWHWTETKNKQKISIEQVIKIIMVVSLKKKKERNLISIS